jgi:beta-lactamase regulating signal transducer with metallopeptidase domain
MNGLGMALFWSSIQVTLTAATALILERLASRRGPRAGSWVAAVSLLIVVVLTPLAFCPLPTLLTRRCSDSSGRTDAVVREGSSSTLHGGGPMNGSSVSNSDPAERAGRGGVPWQFLARKLGAGLRWGSDSIRQPRAAVPRTWCIVLLAGTACCLVRLMVGLWAVRDCRWKSVAIGDPEVLALVEELRIALRVRRSIEIRALPGMPRRSVAAVGWKRPLVLLPGDWRSWNDSERRAVLAHEVAHIARGDYAAGVVARLGLALHFYHPLVHWMVGRLQLQQELAADADGARLAGGRRAYLLALSRLALGLEKGRLAWPATPFFRTKGHLIRRIQMLKEHVPASYEPMPAAARVVTIALLVAIGVGALVLRGPSPIHGAETPPGTDKNTSNPSTAAPKPSNSQPFDLSYLPSTSAGFVAIRPAAMFQLPACKPQLEWLNALIAKEFPLGMPKIENIEQAAFEVSVLPRDRSKKQPGRFMTRACVLRTVEDFDWKTAMKAFFKRMEKTDLDLVEVRLDGKVYYKSAKSHYPRPLGPDSFYLPDARTIVWDYEDNLRQLIRQEARTGPVYAGGDDWRKVNKGLIAVAIDTRDRRWTLDANTDEPDDLLVAPLFQQPGRWVLGIDCTDSLTLHAIATCGTEEKGELLARTAKSLLDRARVALSQVKTTPSKDEKDEIAAGAMRLEKEFVQASIVRREGLTVDIRATSNSRADTLIKLILAGM